ncbi:MAG: hypothetical protein PVH18_12720 [Chloroflexota bacterium]
MINLNGLVTRLERQAAETPSIPTAADWPYPVHTLFDPVATLLPDGATMHLYYGAAASSISLDTGSVHAMPDWLEQHG